METIRIPREQVPIADQLHLHMADDTVREQIAHEAACKVGAAVAEAGLLVQQVESIDGQDALEIPGEKQFFSIGHACQLLQIPPDGIRAAMKAAGVAFAESRNDIGYLNAPGLIAVSRSIRETRASANKQR